MEVKTFDSSLAKFLSSLGDSDLAKVLRTIDLLEIFGSRLNMPHTKKISDGIFELRIRGKKEVRILYAFHKNQAILLNGFIKKGRKTPRSEIKTAIHKRLTLI